MPNPIVVPDADSLAHAVRALQGCDRIALDTEGNGMHAYRTDLCVIQLCEAVADRPADDVFIIDALAVTDLEPLAALLRTRTSLIHDLSFDARLLAGRNVKLGPVLDTAVHARFLGLPETGLMKLLATRAGVAISKAMQHDDWARRPFSVEQVAYLASDVAYLGVLASGLEADAAALGIGAEIAEETNYALACAVEDEGDEPPYARIKGARALPPVGRAVLRELWLARESLAASWDVPSGRVLSNAGLIALAKRRPSDAKDVARVGGLQGRAMHYANTFLAAIRRGENDGDVPEADRPAFAREVVASAEIHARREREKRLGAWRQRESAERGVDLQVVIPGHVLADLVRFRPRDVDELARIPGIGRVRVDRYGAALLAVLDESDAAGRGTDESA